MSIGASLFLVGAVAFTLFVLLLKDLFGMPTPVENEQVRNWREALEKVDIKVETKALEDAYESNVLREINVIPYELIFSKNNYNSLLYRLFPETKWNYENNGYTESGVEVDSLEPALYVKNLLNYIRTILESKKLVGNDSNREQWSSEAREKWDMLDKEQMEAENLIHLIIYPDYYVNEMDDVFRISFSKEAILSEKERLQLVDEKIAQTKPIFRKNDVNSDIPVTSPALVEINDFLNQHELPEEVERELKETMKKIQEKLENQTRKSDEERLLLDANVLNTTAKDYHQLS